MSAPNPKVEFFFEKAPRWRDEMLRLRAILLDMDPLIEEVKWGVPCFTYDGANVVLIHGFKDYCALLFHKGALLADPAGILVIQTENVQSARQVRFTSMDQILQQEPILRAYVSAAIEVQKSGAKVDFVKSRDLTYPQELQDRLDADADLAAAFDALTPGRRRAYNLYFTGAKLAKTRAERVAKSVDRIKAGKGLDD